MNRDGTLNNTGNVANPNPANAYLPDLHSHSIQNKFPHVRNIFHSNSTRSIDIISHRVHLTFSFCMISKYIHRDIVNSMNHVQKLM
jgi:hypothetical protein